MTVTSTDTLILRRCVVDLAAPEVRVGQETQRLTPLETRFLRYLADASPRTVPRGEALEEIWNYSPDSRSRCIHILVSRVRNKLQEDHNPVHLQTMHGSGYRLVDFARPDQRGAPGLVGRQVELEALLNHLRSTSPGWVVLQGPRGVGKSRLLHEAIEASRLGLGEIAVHTGDEAPDPHAELGIWVRTTPGPDLGFPTIYVAPLAGPAAQALLTAALRDDDPSIDSAPDAVDRVMRHCGGRPLTLWLAGRCVGHYGWEGLAARLERSLDALRDAEAPEDTDDDLDSIIRDGWEALPQRLRETTALLTVLGDSFTLDLVRAATSVIHDPATPKELEDANVIGLLERGRWRLDPMMRDAARSQPAPGQLEPARQAAMTRLVEIAEDLLEDCHAGRGIGPIEQLELETPGLVSLASADYGPLSLRATVLLVGAHQFGVDGVSEVQLTGWLARHLSTRIDNGQPQTGAVHKVCRLAHASLQMRLQNYREVERAAVLALDQRPGPDAPAWLAMLAESTLRQGRLTEATAHCHRALDAAGRWGDVIQSAFASDRMATLLRRASRFEDAEQYSLDSLEAYDRANNDFGLASALSNRSALLIERGDLESARRSVLASLEHLMHLEAMPAARVAEGNLGTIERHMGLYDQARERFERLALTAASTAFAGSRSKIHRELALADMAGCRYASASEHLARALHLARAARLPREVAWSQAYIGWVHLAHRRHTVALQVLDHALITFEALDRGRGGGLSLLWSAMALSGLGRREEAWVRLRRAARFLPHAWNGPLQVLLMPHAEFPELPMDLDTTLTLRAIDPSRWKPPAH